MRKPPTPPSNPADPNGSQPDAVDRGLAEAFGEGEARPVSTTALQALQARAGSQLGLQLDERDDEGVSAQVTEGAQQLRDPSGRYQVLGEIGRGGVGVVYKGRDSDLGRDVAMKVLKDEYADRPDVLARFVEEAQIGGQLQHPGIVPVYELGLQAGERPYFAMKLVKGETLAAQLARRSGAAEDRRRFLGIFEQMCQTAAYAHIRRVMHRDLKPANVMIGAFGEVQIVDWGFAKVLPKGGVVDEKESVQRASERSVIETVRSQPGSGSHSRAGSVLGTPAYMSPEQAAGDIDHLDCRSDVFGLGAILCEILTGEPPYREADGDLVRQAANAELDGAFERLQQCGADESLIALCKECLARARRARPESAAELADRVSAYLTSVEERARQAELRAAEARYKHRTTLLAAAAGLVILVLGSGAWIWNENQARTRREETRQNIAAAMSAASGALGQARAKAEGLDLALWGAALAGVENVRSLTQAEDVDAAARADANALLDRVKEERDAARSRFAILERDKEMRRRLEILRMPTDDDVFHSGKQTDLQRMNTEYEAAFAEYLGGTSPTDQPAIFSLPSMQEGDIELELASSLDHWGLVRAELAEKDHSIDDAGTDVIRELASLLDSLDPWRARLRSLLPDADQEGERLRSLAEEVDLESLTAAGCRVLGEALWRAGEQEASVDVLRRGQEVHPTDFGLCFRLGLAHDFFNDPPGWQEMDEATYIAFRREQREYALATYRIANALRPEHGEVLHSIGRVLEKLDRPAEAERLYRRLVAAEPEHPHWQHHLGTSALAQYRSDGSEEEQRRLEESMGHFQQAIRLDPDDHYSYPSLALVYLIQQKPDEALATCREADDLVHLDAHSYLSLAQRYIVLDRAEEALPLLERARELDPFCPGIRYVYGHLILERDPQQAAEHLQVAASLYGKEMRARALNELGAALEEQGKLDEAAECFEQSMEIDRDQPNPHINLGHVRHQQGRLDEAMKVWRSAPDAPESAEWFLNKAGEVENSGRDDLAVELCEMAADLFAQAGTEAAREYQSHAYSNRGLLLQKLDQMDAAIESLRKALELFSGNALAYGHLGYALRAQGKLAEAIECFEKQVEIDPEPWSLLRLGIVLKEHGDLDRAIEVLRRVIGESSDDPRAHNTLGLALAEQGRAEEAMSCYRRAVEIAPRYPNARINLGYKLQERGELRQALEQFEIAAELFGAGETAGRDWESLARGRAEEIRAQIKEDEAGEDKGAGKGDGKGDGQ